MVRLAIWLMSLVVVLFLAVHPALAFRFDVGLGRRSVHVHGLTHRGVCVVAVARTLQIERW